MVNDFLNFKLLQVLKVNIMAIKTIDIELDNVLNCLEKIFPNKHIHGECLLNDYPENYRRVFCNNVPVIIYINDYGNLKDCHHFCREKEILRLKNKTNEH